VRHPACLLLAALTLAPLLRAQQPQATFRATTRLVVQLVTVRDRDGKAVAGLTPADFVLEENGVRQTIAFVEYQAIDDPAAQPAAIPARSGAAPVTAAGPLVPRDDRYRGRRLLVFYLDLVQMPFFDKLRTFENARAYVSRRMTPVDAIAVMVFDGSGLRLRQDFTDDRSALMEVLEELEVQAGAENSDSGVSTIAASAFGEGEAAFNLFTTDRQLAALQTAVTGFAAVPELKTLMYFGSGLRMTGADNLAQMRATVNAAVRANVTINPIDARGLVAVPPMGDAGRASPSGIGMFAGTTAQSLTTQFQRSQDALHAIAKDTGGRAMFDNNDLSLSIARAADAVTGYYLIGYYSTHAAADGKYRRTKITLAQDRGWNVSYRPGYYGDRPYNRFTRVDMERQLTDALRLEDPITDIPLAAEINYFRLNSAEYYVPVSVRMPASEVVRAKDGRAARLDIDMIGEIKDEFGVTVRNMRDKIATSLSADASTRVAGQPLQYETGFTVLPGNYVIKLLVRNIGTGRIGTFQTSFVVPHLDRETAKLGVSSVVLSTSRRAPEGALYRVKQRIAQETMNPLIHEGLMLVPSVTRTFSSARPFDIYLQAYPQGPAAGRGVAAFAAFYRDGAKVFEMPADTVEPAPSGVNIRFSVPAGALPPGTYDCQVTALHPASSQAAFSRVAIAIR
jgi:VWFA-related protein